MLAQMFLAAAAWRIGQQCLWLGQWQGHQIIDCRVVRSLAAGQDEPDRQSLIVAAGVDLARKAAA